MVTWLVFAGLLWSQDPRGSIWPRFEEETAPGVWSWEVALGLHVQGIQRPRVPDTTGFYERFRDYDDFVKHTQRPSYLSVEVSRRFENGWSVVSRTDVYPNWLQTEKEIRYPGRIKDLDSHTNTRGILQKTGKNYAFKIGRDFLVWDPRWTGTLLTDQIPSFDQIRADLWGSRWYYHAFVGDVNRRDVFRSDNEYKFLTGHRLDVKPVANLLVWVAELQVITRPLSLADLNPIFLVYHNLERIHRTHNAITSLGFRWQVRDNLEVSAQLDMDEVESASFEVYTENQNAFAYQVAILHRKFQLSYVKTWPWIYNHEAKTETHNTTFVFPESQDRKGAVYFDRFIGHPMGSGAAVLQGIVTVFPGLEIQYRHLERTPSHILETISVLETPEPVETRNRLAFVYRREISQRFTARVAASWEHSANYRHSNTNANLKEWLVGVAYRFSGPH